MTASIPQRSRNLVKGRDFGRCIRCAGRGTAWHHRRSRSVVDEHTHCPCNGVWLCKTCHDWVHAHPFEARTAGWIVSRHVEQPSDEPVDSHFGTLLLMCDGLFVFTTRKEEL